MALCALALAALSGPSQAAQRGGALTKNDVLTIRDGKFYLQGKPFAEISFNKFDLFWEIFDLINNGKADTQEYRDMIASEDHALSDLHEMGFHSIRFFAAPWGNWTLRPVFDDPVKRESIFHKAMDATLDLCDKNQIKVVYSLGAADFDDTAIVNGKWVHGPEEKRELIADPNSRGRQELYRYIDDVVGRYKNRKTILMWEISNETTLGADIIPDQNNIYQGERMPNLADVAHFFNDVATRIKADDPLHLVNSGGSCLRGSQWNMYTRHNWTKDTLAEQAKAFDLLYANSAVDVIDIHYYTNNKNINETIQGANGEALPMNIQRCMEAVRPIGKPVMIGELGITLTARDNDPKNKKIYEETPDFIASVQDPNAPKWIKILCDEIVAGGPQLVYWWEYSSNRPGDIKNPIGDIKRGATDPDLAVIIDANKRLKAKFGAK